MRVEYQDWEIYVLRIAPQGHSESVLAEALKALPPTSRPRAVSSETERYYGPFPAAVTRKEEARLAQVS